MSENLLVIIDSLDNIAHTTKKFRVRKKRIVGTFKCLFEEFLIILLNKDLIFFHCWGSLGSMISFQL